MIRKRKLWILSLLSLLVCFFIRCSCCMAAAEATEQTMTIKMSEAQRLNRNFDRLSVLSELSRKELTLQKQELKTVQKELEILRASSTRQTESLQTANKLFEMYKKEAEAKQRQLNRQKSFAYLLAGLAMLKDELDEKDMLYIAVLGGTVIYISF